MYEFQFGKRPFDPDGPNYGIPESAAAKKGHGDARTTKLDDLDLKPERVFGYWFDFGDDWFHQIEVERIEQAIPTVTYPRVIKRVGKSPPQYRRSIVAHSLATGSISMAAFPPSKIEPVRSEGEARDPRRTGTLVESIHECSVRC